MLKPEQLLLEMGFKLGDLVERKKKDSPLKGRIVSVTGDRVVVLSEESASEVVVDVKSFLHNDFAKCATAKVHEIQWELQSAARSSEIQRLVLYGKVMHAIDKVCKKYSKSWSALTMCQLGNSKYMTAKRDIEPGELTLVPITLTVNVFKPGTKKDLERNVWLGEVKGFEVTLSPCFTLVDKDEEKKEKEKEGFVNPFWMVTSVEKVEDVNLNMKLEPLAGVGLNVPTFVNCRKIAAGERIRIIKGDFPSKFFFEGKRAAAEDVDAEPPKRRRK
jgi:hypothetical protein